MEIVLAVALPTKRLPALSIARLCGNLSPLVTKADTVPPGVTLRMAAWPGQSTYRLPAASNARNDGPNRLASLAKVEADPGVTVVLVTLLPIGLLLASRTVKVTVPALTGLLGLLLT